MIPQITCDSEEKMDSDEIGAREQLRSPPCPILESSQQMIVEEISEKVKIKN